MFDFTPGQTLATDDSTETQFGWSGNPSCNAAAPFSANGSSSLFSFDSPVMPPAHEYTAILSAKNTMPEEGASLGTPTATQTSSFSVQSQERQDPARMQTLECADLSLPMPMDVDTPLLQGEFELQGQTAGRTSEPLHASNDPITKKPPLHSKGSAPLQIKLPDFSQSRLIAPGPGIRKQVAQLSQDVNPLANRAPEVVGRSPTPKSIDLAIRSSTTRTLIAQPRSPFSPKKTSTLSSSASPAATSSLSQNEIGCMLTGDLEEKKQKRKAEREEFAGWVNSMDDMLKRADINISSLKKNDKDLQGFRSELERTALEIACHSAEIVFHAGPVGQDRVRRALDEAWKLLREYRAVEDASGVTPIPAAG